MHDPETSQRPPELDAVIIHFKAQRDVKYLSQGHAVRSWGASIRSQTIWFFAITSLPLMLAPSELGPEVVGPRGGR